MPTFVLVHGSGQNAASWHPVAERLRARGHHVLTPELEKAARGLGEHAAQVAAATPPDSIVVAHSLSGVLLPLVAAARPCRVLAFVAAVIPEPGRSVRGQFAADATMFAPEWIAQGPRWRDPAAVPELARSFLFHDAEPEDLPAMLATMAPLDPSILVTESAPFTRWCAPTACLVATADRTLQPAWIERTCRRVLRHGPDRIETGHCPHQVRPDATARWLDGLASARRDVGAGVS
ncbi:MAG: alpha/beta hydrolase [Planctomycetes bacterium]|nr:alpha/beta hydrolase [Planctomycetota bacterium]